MKCGVGWLLVRAFGALVLVALAALVGFASALLRRRPPTSYAAAFHQPVPQPAPRER
jgi:cell division septation protein DedD